MRAIIPNVNSKQQEFYSRHILSEAYHKDVDGYLVCNSAKMVNCMQVIQESCCFNCN